MMKELIKDLIKKWTCLHEWERYHRNSVYKGDHDKLPHTTMDTLICKKCGKITKIKL